MFTSFVEGGEDPATGPRVEIAQGAEIGRPSRLVAEMEGDRPRVGGSVVGVIEGEVAL